VENTLLIGLSRQVSLERQLGVIANNVANVNTSGFKADNSLFEEYLMPTASAEEFPGRDRFLSYTQDRATWHDFSAGAIEQTKNPLDVAISGEGMFVVQTIGGERYTRNGAFQINAQGQLVTTDGNAVLGESGPIVFQPGDQNIAIAQDGTVTVREGANTAVDSLRGKIRIVRFDQPQRLVKEGANLFSAPEGLLANAVGTQARVQQGAIEKSNVSAVTEMTRMVDVMRAYQNIATLLQQQAALEQSAIEKLAEVPA